jgi:hypothetical protein
MSLEQPVPDAVEQSQDAITGEQEQDAGAAASTPLEADEADAAEQSRDLGPDEDDYR